MTVALTGTGGFFAIAGKAIHAIETKILAQGTTVPAEIVDLLTAWEGLPDDAEYTGLLRSVPDVVVAEKADTRIADTLAQAIRGLLLLMVTEDTQLASNDLRSAVLELIRQMVAAGASVDASTASVSVTPGGSNTGDAVLIASAIDGFGRNVQHAIPETVEVDVLGSALRLTGKASVSNPLSANWPAGSGASLNVASVLPEGSMIPDGAFDEEHADEANRPDGWEVVVGTPGTTIKLTTVEQQTVAISGTPTSGVYTLSYTNAAGDVFTTAPLPFNASGDDVEDALQALDGLEEIEVTGTTGLTPNFTHTIKFTGVAGNVATLSSSETFDAGSIAHNTTVAGSAHAYRGRALEFDSNGSELTAIRKRLTGLQPNAVYAWNLKAKVDVFPAAGALKVELIDGAGNVIDDDAGTANEASINPQSGGGLSTSAFTNVNGFFRTPALVPAVVYLRLRISTAVSSGSSVFFDDLAFIGARLFYVGGPYVQSFGTPGAKDTFTLTVGNDRAGKFQEFAFRLGLTTRGQLLPSKADGTETINDSLIG